MFCLKMFLVGLLGLFVFFVNYLVSGFITLNENKCFYCQYQ
jgi:hypothetical protein